MLRLQLRVPSELSDDVVSLLEDDETVTNVAVLPDGFRKPPGTLIIADVARENTTAVIETLRTLGIHKDGSISIDPIETILSDAADEAERLAPGAPDDAVVWESVEQRLRSDSTLTWVFVAFMTLASLIAGTGRILDEPILIVGAMVVGPEFAPIAAICFGLARPRWSMVPRAAGSLVGGFAIAAAVSSIVWIIAYQLGCFTAHAASTGTQTAFIVSPNAWSFSVAVLAGIAGVLSLTTEKSGPLVGVFISITTIPSVGTFAVCVAAGIWGQVGDCGIQLGLNILGLILAGTLTLLVQRFVWRRIGAHIPNALRAGVR